MRVFAGALLALLASGPNVAGAGNLAVTLDSHAVPRTCAVVSTATIVAYDAASPNQVVYRFRRSDGTVSRTGTLDFSGDGAIAQSVRDTWTPRGATPWIALEIVAPQKMQSPRHTVIAHCSRRDIAVSR